VTRAATGGEATGQRGHDAAVQGVMGRPVGTHAGSDAGEGDGSAGCKSRAGGDACGRGNRGVGARAQEENQRWEVECEQQGARGTAPTTRCASWRACCGRIGWSPEGLLALHRGAWDPSVMGTLGHRLHAGSS
jgi:hypothetical protein